MRPLYRTRRRLVAVELRASHGRSHSNQHRVAVAVEAVSAARWLAVRREHGSRPANAATSISSDDRGRWKLVSSASTTRNSMPGWMNSVGRAGAGTTRPSVRARRVSSARVVVVPTATTRRPLARARADRVGGRLGDHVALGIHACPRPVDAHRLERAVADVQRDRDALDAARARARRAARREMQAGGRRRDRSRARARTPSGSARDRPRVSARLMYGGSGMWPSASTAASTSRRRDLEADEPCGRKTAFEHLRRAVTPGARGRPENRMIGRPASASDRGAPAPASARRSRISRADPFQEDQATNTRPRRRSGRAGRAAAPENRVLFTTSEIAGGTAAPADRRCDACRIPPVRGRRPAAATLRAGAASCAISSSGRSNRSR